MQTFKDLWYVFVMAMLPIVELRGAIPLGVGMGYPVWEVFIISLIGSSLPVPFIIFFLKPVRKFLGRYKPMQKFNEFLDRHAFKRGQNVLKYSYWGLLLFVAVPLPGTGAWTGSLIASVLGLRAKYAIPVIIAGNVIAGFAMLLLSYGTKSLFT